MNADIYLERFKAMKRDPWEFATKMVFTKDEVDRINPIKRFPAHLQYQKLYMRIWQKFPKVAVPKSRRMMMSWTNILLYTWDTLFNVGRQQAFVSKKETDSHELIERSKFILENLDFSYCPKELFPAWSCKFGELAFKETGSRLLGFPSGADQLRQFTFSGLLFDEAAFWENAEEAYSSAVPTIEGGGRLTLISSPAPGFFKNVVFDQLNDGRQNLTSPEKFPLDRFPMEGVEVWQNPNNKFVVYQLHYSADPKKRDPNWLDNIRSSMSSAKFNQEYNLQWDTFHGKPVFPDFSERLHAVEEASPEFGLPLLLGVDQGLNAACIVCQVQGDRFVVLREIIGVNMGAERFVDRVCQELSLHFPEWSDLKKDFLVYMDPAGFSRRDVDERTYASVWVNRGFKRTFPGPMLWEERRQAVENLILKQTKQGSCLQVVKGDNQLLLRGFNGGYRYNDKNFEIEPNRARPIKDEHSHVQDALQYLAGGFYKTQSKSGKTSIPELKYSSYATDKRTDHGIFQQHHQVGRFRFKDR
jgi:hypothetical protein